MGYKGTIAASSWTKRNRNIKANRPFRGLPEQGQLYFCCFPQQGDFFWRYQIDGSQLLHNCIQRFAAFFHHGKCLSDRTNSCQQAPRHFDSRYILQQREQHPAELIFTDLFVFFRCALRQLCCTAAVFSLIPQHAEKPCKLFSLFQLQKCTLLRRTEQGGSFIGKNKLGRRKKNFQHTFNFIFQRMPI